MAQLDGDCAAGNHGDDSDAIVDVHSECAIAAGNHGDDSDAIVYVHSECAIAAGNHGDDSDAIIDVHSECAVAAGNHGDDIDGIVDDHSECAVCMEPLEWVAIGLCGHHEVCSTCTVHIRVFEHDRRCCICRQQCPAIVVTGAGRGSRVYAELASLVNMGRVEHEYDDLYSYHSISAAYFDDKQQFEDTRSVCSHLDDPDEATSKRLVPRGPSAASSRPADFHFDGRPAARACWC
jgi:hypothetical protein